MGGSYTESRLRDNRCSSAALTCGQSSSMTAYHAESRRSPPRTTMCLRWIPSNSAGRAASARRLADAVHVFGPERLEDDDATFQSLRQLLKLHDVHDDG